MAIGSVLEYLTITVLDHRVGCPCRRNGLSAIKASLRGWRSIDQRIGVFPLCDESSCPPWIRLTSTIPPVFSIAFRRSFSSILNIHVLYTHTSTCTLSLVGGWSGRTWHELNAASPLCRPSRDDAVCLPPPLHPLCTVRWSFDTLSSTYEYSASVLAFRLRCLLEAFHSRFDPTSSLPLSQPPPLNPRRLFITSDFLLSSPYPTLQPVLRGRTSREGRVRRMARHWLSCDPARPAHHGSDANSPSIPVRYVYSTVREMTFPQHRRSRDALAREYCTVLYGTLASSHQVRRYCRVGSYHKNARQT